MITTLEDLIGGKEEPKKELKPIEVTHVCKDNLIFVCWSAICKEFDEVVLISRNYAKGLDMFYAFNSKKPYNNALYRFAALCSSGI